MSQKDVALAELNLDIVAQESAGDVLYFERLLADEFAMRRADLATFMGRAAFIAGVAESPARSTEDFEVILEARTVAVTRCTVAKATGGGLSRSSDVRLFVRGSEREPWRILAWANEALHSNE
jgi:hypothetical protein